MVLTHVMAVTKRGGVCQRALNDPNSFSCRSSRSRINLGIWEHCFGIYLSLVWLGSLWPHFCAVEASPPRPYNSYTHDTAASIPALEIECNFLRIHQTLSTLPASVLACNIPDVCLVEHDHGEAIGGHQQQPGKSLIYTLKTKKWREMQRWRCCRGYLAATASGS